MRIIKESALHSAGRTYPDAASALDAWRKTVRAARWQSLADVRATYSHADPVRVASHRTVTVFNIGGGKYRLITALHYDRRIVYILRFLTHAEYDRNRWKSEL